MLSNCFHTPSILFVEFPLLEQIANLLDFLDQIIDLFLELGEGLCQGSDGLVFGLVWDGDDEVFVEVLQGSRDDVDLGFEGVVERD